MRLAYALQNPKVWMLALVAGIVGLLVHRNRAPVWSFVGYFAVTVLIAMAMPATTYRSSGFPYFGYGLVLGPIVGALHPVRPTTTMDGSPELHPRVQGALVGAGLGMAINLVLRLWTYS